VDTGASGVARADAKLVSALDLPPQGTATNSDGMHAATVETVRIDTLELGGLARKRVEAIAREFFADGLLVIDYPARTLTFSRAQTLSPGDANALAYQRAFRVPVSIGALRTEGNIDTGANVALVMPTALYDRIDAGPLQAAGRGDLANGKVETQRAVVHGPLRIGGLELAEAEARVSERYPELLVGAYALQQSTLVIDQRSRRIAVCPD
jgi:predicted aspartyl protease